MVRSKMLLTCVFRKLEEWDDEDTFGPSLTDADRLGPGPQGVGANLNSRVVVLKHMFTLKELEEDATLLLDLKEDVREECETLGEVTNVVLYDVRLVLVLLSMPASLRSSGLELFPKLILLSTIFRKSQTVS